MLLHFVLVCEWHMQAIVKIKIKLREAMKVTWPSKLICPLLYNDSTIKETTDTISETVN
jgi:hypothetical protein